MDRHLQSHTPLHETQNSQCLPAHLSQCGVPYRMPRWHLAVLCAQGLTTIPHPLSFVSIVTVRPGQAVGQPLLRESHMPHTSPHVRPDKISRKGVAFPFYPWVSRGSQSLGNLPWHHCPQVSTGITILTIQWKMLVRRSSGFLTDRMWGGTTHLLWHPPNPVLGSPLHTWPHRLETPAQPATALPGEGLNVSPSA